MHSYSLSCRLLHVLILLQVGRKDIYSITMTIQEGNVAAAEKVSCHFLTGCLILGIAYEMNI